MTFLLTGHSGPTVSDVFADGSFRAPVSDVFLTGHSGPPELSAKSAKQGVETTPRVYTADNPPRPSRPKASLGLV